MPDSINARDDRPAPAATEVFAHSGLRGEHVTSCVPVSEDEVRRLIDPAAAVETIHWGRNYLYLARLQTVAGPVEVVVKQFRNQGLRARLSRRWRGSKALRSFRMAREFAAAGVPTPEALLLIESTEPEGPSYFVSRHLAGVVEARYLFRAVHEGKERDAFPEVDFNLFLRVLARSLRKMHDRGFFHRDLSIGNVLLRPAAGGAAIGMESVDLQFVDLNRARKRSRVGLSQRVRDLCRLPLFERKHREIFLDAYWDGNTGGLRRALYLLYHRGFYFRIESKKKLRRVTRYLRDWVLPRRAHAHIPPAEPGASTRDKIVWDYLSDQPHQHATKLEKLTVRIRDVPNYAWQTAVFLSSAPAIWRRYRRLQRDLYRQEVPWCGVGVCVRPHPADPEKLLAALDDLDLRHVLLRLHPWEDDHEADEELARELQSRDVELAFALPQNRELVRDPVRWRAKIEELAERFTPYGRHFQVGQAINRSKWGIWRAREYLELASASAEILRRYPGVEIFGPAVIDFEAHVTAAVLNLPGLDFRFDGVASLLYVDRRGAPERTQLGFDTAGKVLLMQAIAETARNCGPRSWITEVNWPLWEGPHSPAGRGVSVDEPTQARYLARYYLLSLTTGAAERVYWWQLIARGYGLIAPAENGELRRRPAFQALRTLDRQLRGHRFVGRLPSPPETYLLEFEHPGGGRRIAGWSLAGRRLAKLPGRPSATVELEGRVASTTGSPEIELSPSVRYFHLHI